jgi:hypothetical protein
VRIALCVHLPTGDPRDEQGGFFPSAAQTLALAQRRRAQADGSQSLVERYVMGDERAQGLLGRYVDAGHTVRLLSPALAVDRLEQCLPHFDGIDLTLSVLSGDIARRLLHAGKRVLGYRHPAIECKATVALLLRDLWQDPGDPALPAQAWLPRRSGLDAAIIARVEELLAADFYICKGNASARSREGLFEHLFVARGHLHAALRDAAMPWSGVTVSGVVVTDGWHSGEVRKITFAAQRYEADGALHEPLGACHYLIPNRLDTAHIRRGKVVRLGDVLSCDGSWRAAPHVTVPAADRLAAALHRIDPLGCLTTVDVMVAGGRTWWLEANHFSATYLDNQFGGRAPIDCAADLADAAHGEPERQAQWLATLERRLAALGAHGFLTRPTFLPGHGPPFIIEVP